MAYSLPHSGITTEFPMTSNSLEGPITNKTLYEIHIRLLVLYMNPWDSIAILIEISWGIYWATLYLPNLSNSLLHQTITMAHFLRSLIYLFLNVCCCSWAVQAGQCSHHAACKRKQIAENGFSPCKNSFYVKSFRLPKQWFAKIWKI